MAFFFLKQKTAYEMRISDWSSDVCSSDLRFERHFRHDLSLRPAEMREQDRAAALRHDVADCRADRLHAREVGDAPVAHGHVDVDAQIGRASGRERVCQYV